MQNTSTDPVMANRAVRTCARRLPFASRLARLLAALATASLMAIPAARAAGQWLSPHFQDHPLVGTIWTSAFKPATPGQLETAVLEANFIMLGEIHTNADQHRLQAQMIEALARAGRHPAVVWEMIPASMQAELDSRLQNGPKDAGGLGAFLHWEERGWPRWAIYQPVAEAALSAGLPLFGGALDRETTRAISKMDPSQADLLMALKLDRPVKPGVVEGLSKEIEEGHCNLLPKAAVKPMVMVQRATDAHLAKITAEAAPKDGAVLIAGAGHARKDWAVPSFIKETLPDASVLSVAFFEVDPDRRSPSDYVDAAAGLEAPYDFIYFTPKADLIDRCAEMSKHIEMKKPRQ